MPSNTPPQQSLLVRTWNLLSSALGRSASQPLSSAALIASAMEKSGSKVSLPADAATGLEHLVGALNESADLHPFGRYYVSELLVGLLSNHLKLLTYQAAHPEVINAPVSRPLIILGLPRSGTSFLFNLLACDPEHRYLSNWETTVSQMPPRQATAREHDPRRRTGRFLMAFQRYLAPQLEHIHEFYLDGPEECTPILMQSFATQALAGMFNVPGYSTWLDHVDHRPTYVHHRGALQVLQATYPAKRWLLKSPDHLAALDCLLDTYPDACLVHLHRDPVQSVASWASLNAAFRGICASRIDNVELGQQVLQRLATDMDAYLAARRRRPEHGVLDIPYKRLIADPMGTVSAIYGHFGLEFGGSARSQLSDFLAKDREKPRSHRYTPEDFGLSGESIRERFADYMSTFDLGPGKPASSG
ncbi:sulfotransferase family protein [Thauera mechernichensis]